MVPEGGDRASPGEASHTRRSEQEHAMMNRKSDKQLAFEEQALCHADVLHRYGMRLTRNCTDADDLVQETYLKAYRFWDSYDQGTNLRAWLFRIMRNSFINLYRKEAKEPPMVDYSDVVRTNSAHPMATGANSVQESVFQNLFDDEVSNAMADLPEDFRTVVILCDLEELTYAEIAGFVHCPLGTVRSRLHRGRKLLHATLHAYAKDRGYLRLPRSTQKSTPGSVRALPGPQSPLRVPSRKDALLVSLAG
jgi:RNA polymerase sigma-70 factor (ECF subfamily)